MVALLSVQEKYGGMGDEDWGRCMGSPLQSGLPCSMSQVHLLRVRAKLELSPPLRSENFKAG